MNCYKFVVDVWLPSTVQKSAKLLLGLLLGLDIKKIVIFMSKLNMNTIESLHKIIGNYISVK